MSDVCRFFGEELTEFRSSSADIVFKLIAVVVEPIASAELVTGGSALTPTDSTVGLRRSALDRA